MFGKSVGWSGVTASGGALVCVLALAVWEYARLPHSSAPASKLPAATLAHSATPALPVAAPAPEASAPVPAIVSSALRADVVRVSPNGDVVVVGRAEPGSRVTLLDNGEPLMEMQVDPATGEFVFLPPRLPAGAHTLSLRGAPPADGGPAPERELMAFSIAPNVKAAPPLPQPATAPSPPLVLKSDMRTVARGDTLWRISRERLGRGALYTTIVQANSDKIRNPHLIYPGQSLTLPRAP